MDVTPTIRRADERAATAVPAAKEYRSAFPQVPVTIAAGGTGQGSGWHASSVERPSTRVAIIDSWPSPTPGDWEQAWGALLMSHCRGSAGIVSVSCEYGPLLLHVGSSPLIVDRRSVQRPPRTDARLSADGFELLPVVDQLKELRAALSLNKSQLARIMRVTRPTIYEWYQGKDPNAVNCERIRTLLRVLKRSVVSGAKPLNARFVRQPMGPAEPSLLDLLSEHRLDQKRVARAVKRARDLGAEAFRRRENREDRLRALGFEDPTGNQRKEQLARNVALQDWPKR